jgi:hypothetical protein
MTILNKPNCLNRGFFSLFIEAIRAIDYSVTNNLTYHIDWSKNCFYSSNNENSYLNYFTNSSNECFISLPYINGFVYQKVWFLPHIKRLHYNGYKQISLNPDFKLYIHKLLSKYSNEKLLGVHIRRTDHSYEVPFVHISVYMSEVEKLLVTKRYSKIFLATDCNKTLNIFIKKFGDNCLFNECYRSSDDRPIHVYNKNVSGYDLGLEALSDIFTLSICKKLILCDSNLSYSALILNPEIPFKLLKYNSPNIFFNIRTSILNIISHYRYVCVVNNKFKKISSILFLIEKK